MKHAFTSKTDLAQAYFPYIDERSARHKLMLIINGDANLLAQLKSTGYNPLCHAFSPVQMQIIFDRLGNPFG